MSTPPNETSAFSTAPPPDPSQSPTSPRVKTARRRRRERELELRAKLDQISQSMVKFVRNSQEKRHILQTRFNIVEHDLIELSEKHKQYYNEVSQIFQHFSHSNTALQHDLAQYQHKYQSQLIENGRFRAQMNAQLADFKVQISRQSNALTRLCQANQHLVQSLSATQYSLCDLTDLRVKLEDEGWGALIDDFLPPYQSSCSPPSFHDPVSQAHLFGRSGGCLYDEQTLNGTNEHYHISTHHSSQPQPSALYSPRPHHNSILHYSRPPSRHTPPMQQYSQHQLPQPISTASPHYFPPQSPSPNHFTPSYSSTTPTRQPLPLHLSSQQSPAPSYQSSQSTPRAPFRSQLPSITCSPNESGAQNSSEDIPPSYLPPNQFDLTPHFIYETNPGSTNVSKQSYGAVSTLSPLNNHRSCRVQLDSIASTPHAAQNSHNSAPQQEQTTSNQLSQLHGFDTPCEGSNLITPSHTAISSQLFSAQPSTPLQLEEMQINSEQCASPQQSNNFLHTSSSASDQIHPSTNPHSSSPTPCAQQNRPTLTATNTSHHTAATHQFSSTTTYQQSLHLDKDFSLPIQLSPIARPIQVRSEDIEDVIVVITNSAQSTPHSPPIRTESSQNPPSFQHSTPLKRTLQLNVKSDQQLSTPSQGQLSAKPLHTLTFASPTTTHPSQPQSQNISPGEFTPMQIALFNQGIPPSASLPGLPTSQSQSQSQSNLFPTEFANSSSSTLSAMGSSPAFRCGFSPNKLIAQNRSNRSRSTATAASLHPFSNPINLDDTVQSQQELDDEHVGQFRVDKKRTLSGYTQIPSNSHHTHHNQQQHQQQQLQSQSPRHLSPHNLRHAQTVQTSTPPQLGQKIELEKDERSQSLPNNPSPHANSNHTRAVPFKQSPQTFPNHVVHFTPTTTVPSSAQHSDPSSQQFSPQMQQLQTPSQRNTVLQQHQHQHQQPSLRIRIPPPVPLQPTHHHAAHQHHQIGGSRTQQTYEPSSVSIIDPNLQRYQQYQIYHQGHPIPQQQQQHHQQQHQEPIHSAYPPPSRQHPAHPQHIHPSIQHPSYHPQSASQHPSLLHSHGFPVQHQVSFYPSSSPRSSMHSTHSGQNASILGQPQVSYYHYASQPSPYSMRRRMLDAENHTADGPTCTHQQYQLSIPLSQLAYPQQQSQQQQQQSQLNPFQLPNQFDFNFNHNTPRTE